MSFGVVAASYYGVVVPSGPPPLAAYDFEQVGAPEYADVTGNGHDLTGSINATAVPGYNSNWAIQSFDDTQGTLGSGAYGAFPGGSPGSSPLTVMLWAQVPDIAQGAVYVSILNDSGRQDPWAVFVETDGSLGAIWFDSADAMSGAPISATPGLLSVDDTWAHIAAVFVPGTGATLYVNGSVATAYAWQIGSSAFYGNWETLLVGSSRWGSNLTTIDDLRIYTEELSGAQIATLMNEPL